MVDWLPQSKSNQPKTIDLEMHPLAFHLHLIVVAASAIGVLSRPASTASTTPAVRFWEKALPGSPVPEVIADLVQKGIDHSPLVEHYAAGVQDSDGQKNYRAVSDGQKNYRVVIDGQKNYRAVGVQDTDLTNYRAVSDGQKNYRAASDGQKNYRAVSDGQKNYRCRGSCPEKSTAFFFGQKEVRVGNTMTFSFPPTLVPPILPRDVAEGVPFGDAPNVLVTFHIAPSSAEATMVRDTLSECQAPAIDPEQKACTTSLEGTVQSAMHMLGDTNNGALWATASSLQRIGLPLQSYMIQGVTALDSDRHVGCHVMPYPYAVYYCHMTGLPTKAYLVSVQSTGGGGPMVTLAALCHLDTSNWNPAHPAFKVVHSQPGGEPICHFMSYGNLLFGEKKAVAGNP